MKTEIIYDGKILDSRLNILKNLSAIVVDSGVHRILKGAEKDLQDKKAFVQYITENNVGSHIFLDVRVAGQFYPVVAVGNYGFAVYKGEGTEHLARELGADRIFEFTEPADLNMLKSPLFGNPYKKYESALTEKLEKTTLANDVGYTYEMDYDAFINSGLWQMLRKRRELLSEKTGSPEYLIWRAADVFAFLSTYPTEPSGACPIYKEYQEIILNTWKDYLYQS